MDNTPGYRIPDIAGAEIRAADMTRKARRGRGVTPRSAEAVRVIHPSGRVPAYCPVIARQCEDGRIITIFDAGGGNDRRRLFFGTRNQTGAGARKSDDLGKCAAASMQVRSDSVGEERGYLPVR